MWFKEHQVTERPLHFHILLELFDMDKQQVKLKLN
jgi:hypothetical protein